jgi:hypothetical protein
MKIKIKSKGKTFRLRVPFWLVEMIPSRLIGFGISYANDSVRDIFRNTDFTELKKSLYSLKDYKGTNIVEVKGRDGSEVVITV